MYNDGHVTETYLLPRVPPSVSSSKSNDCSLVLLDKDGAVLFLAHYIVVDRRKSHYESVGRHLPDPSSPSTKSQKIPRKFMGK